ncbi:MAG: DUF1294 domain-containing protein [Anaerolineae bacterium]
MKRTHIIYTLIGVGVSVLLARSFQERLFVHPYVTWLGATSILTWALYAWDKRMSELEKLLKGWRVPEFVLNLMSFIGGFLGAWIARPMFGHKNDPKRHPTILVVLIVSTVAHVLFALRLIYGPPLTLWPPENWLTF